MKKLDLSLQIPIETDISAKEFDKKYVKPQKPVVLRGLINKQPAGKKWTWDFFRKNYGKLTVPIFDNANKAHENATTTFNHDFEMNFGEYLDIIKKDEHTDLRMFRVNLFKEAPELKSDFTCPPHMKGALGFLGVVFFGGKDTDVRLHYDVDKSHVLLTQVFGEKRIVLFAPEYGDLLYRVPFNMHSNVDLNNPDFDKFPGLKHVKGYDFVLEPGDSVFMPSGWWHYNTYLDGGMGVAYRKVSYKFTDLLRGLWNVAILIPIDKLFGKLFGDKWFSYKKKTVMARVQRKVDRLKTRIA